MGEQTISPVTLDALERKVIVSLLKAHMRKLGGQHARAITDLEKKGIDVAADLLAALITKVEGK